MSSFKQNELLNYIVTNDFSSRLKKYVDISNDDIYSLITNKKKLNNTNYILIFLVFHMCNLSLNALINDGCFRIGDTKINSILTNNFDSSSIIKEVLAFYVIHGFEKPLTRHIVYDIRKHYESQKLLFKEIAYFFKHACKNLDKIFA